MSDSTPPPLPEALTKVIGSYIKRSNELDKFQPVIAYFCKLYAVEVILKEKLHLQSKEIETYAFHLLDQIEVIKAEFKESNPKISELINDRASSFKLVKAFSDSIFQKAFQEISNHTSSRKTVESFKASLDFYNLLNLWEDLYSENIGDIEKQIKYAKFHSMRILKAYKNGEDPNDYISPEEQKDDSAEIDSAFPPAPSGLQTPVASTSETDPATLQLPTAPDDIEDELNMPPAPVLIRGERNELGLPETPHLPPKLPPQPETPKSQQPKPVAKNVQTPKTHGVPNTTRASIHEPESHKISKAEIQKILRDDEIIAMAQKKAKFAISALNYEDVDTAIKELQAALNLLKGDQ
ncbi:hypothetical protein CANARDRAFT_194392 [[Candida] arabinofermentans NRRL YB-2248]|uniref:Vta1 C-terminal domain-containing protein n=1 Tax=[Candida] arabinofermentans NRRL YB-2248 TaxID=983967 RepID=A0A1E4T7C1_9ASCO|nr:hypothetical protein CANARDRAFT_194392 [[Candida] arabinofermentans NRRL YB-2248]